ncbi:calmodulin-regulated spectrin-associated protein 2-like isoform X2 [Antedon mediterranea]|uniref:calmodulin-regulated spectrin-associated protein 2-like isoform X2 n=1 Tax=Antedon mediterranea TaxID=105859 RepID=UPI003AF722B3
MSLKTFFSKLVSKSTETKKQRVDINKADDKIPVRQVTLVDYSSLLMPDDNDDDVMSYYPHERYELVYDDDVISRPKELRGAEDLERYMMSLNQQNVEISKARKKGRYSKQKKYRIKKSSSLQNIYDESLSNDRNMSRNSIERLNIRNTALSKSYTDLSQRNQEEIISPPEEWKTFDSPKTITPLTPDKDERGYQMDSLERGVTLRDMRHRKEEFINRSRQDKYFERKSKSFEKQNSGEEWSYSTPRSGSDSRASSRKSILRQNSLSTSSSSGVKSHDGLVADGVVSRPPSGLASRSQASPFYDGARTPRKSDVMDSFRASMEIYMKDSGGNKPSIRSRELVVEPPKRRPQSLHMPYSMDGGQHETNGLDDSSSESVFELVPFDSYNVTKSKTRASLLWLIHQAYRFGQLPPDLDDPFFKDKDGNDHLKPLIIKLLGSSELYCKAGQQVFNSKDQPWTTHMSVMQALSRRGIYVLDESDQPVTDLVLSKTAKIKLPAHLAMMDALMMAYASELVTVEKIVHAVRKFTTFNASSELPFDLEDGLLFWLNKVAHTTQQIMEKRLREQQQHYIDNPMHKIRLRRPNLPPKDLPTIPLMDNLLTDIGDGCSLALLIHFYCPQGVDFEDISLNKTMSLAESMHNLQLVKAFLDHYAPGSFHFCFEDLLYSHPKLKTNILAILAELFYLTEVESPDWVRPLYMYQQEDSVARYTPQVPISNVTKMSFQAGQMRHATSNPEINKSLSREPLLPKRHHQQYGSHDDILDQRGIDDITVKQSILAWQDNNEAFTSSNRVPIASQKGGSLLANVSIDSDLDDGDLTINNQLTYRMTANKLPSDAATRVQEPMDEADLEIQSLTSPKGSSQGSLYQKDSGVDGLSKSGQSLASKSTGPEYFRQDENEDSKKATVSRTSTFRVERQQQPVHPMVPSSANVIRKETFRVDNRNKGNVRQRFIHSQPVPQEHRYQNNSQYGGQDQRSSLSLDVQSVDMRPPGHSMYTDGIMPANLKPLKEKVNNVNKEQEYGETSSSHSPRSTSSNDSSRVMTSWNRSHGTSGTPDSFGAVTPLSGMSTGSMTSAPSHLNEQRRVFDAPRQQWNTREPNRAKARGGEAFYINTDTEQIGSSDGGYSRHGTGDSFNVNNRGYNVQSMSQQGYMPAQNRRSQEWMGMPNRTEVVHARQSSDPLQLQAYDRYQTPPHDMDPGINHSSGYSGMQSGFTKPFHYQGGENRNYGQGNSVDVQSDHVTYSHPEKESFKLQSEQLTKETRPANEVATSFAPIVTQSHDQINRHELLNHDIIVSRPDITERLEPMHVDVVTSVVNGEPHGMTTWLEKVKHDSDSVPSVDAGTKSDNSWEPSASEMLQLRLQLEEKRRNIDREKRTAERNFSKQRQRVGKAAFMQIINKDNNHDQHRQAENIQAASPPHGKITFADLSAAKQNQNKLKDEPIRNPSPQNVPTSKISPNGNNVHSAGIIGPRSGTHSPHLTNDEYNTSMEKMNANLSQLQNEITRLSQQHEKLIHGIGTEPKRVSPEFKRASPEPKHASPESKHASPESKHASPESKPNTDSSPGGFFLKEPEPVDNTETDAKSSGFYLQDPPAAAHDPLSQDPPKPSDSECFYLSQPEPQLNNRNHYIEQSEDRNDGGSFILHPKPSSPNVVVLQDVPKAHFTDSHTPIDNVTATSKNSIDDNAIDTNRLISDNKIPYDSIYGLSEHVEQAIVTPSGDNNKTNDVYNQAVAAKVSSKQNQVQVDGYQEPVVENKLMKDSEPEEIKEAKLEGLVEKKRFAKFEIGNEDGEVKEKVKARPKRFSINLDMDENEKTVDHTVKKSPPPVANGKAPVEVQKAPVEVQKAPVELRKAPVDVRKAPVEKKVIEKSREPSPVPVEDVKENASNDQSAGNTSVLDESAVSDTSHNKSTGFVIDENKAPDEEDIAKKRDQFLKNRLKRQEQEKAKQAKREAQREKQREEQRRKQEDIEMKKAEDKARRERIRLEYQMKKQQEEEPRVERRTKSAKPRPKSRVIDNSYGGPKSSRGDPKYTFHNEDVPLGLSSTKTSYTISSGDVSQAVDEKLYADSYIEDPPHSTDNQAKHEYNRKTNGRSEALQRRPPSPRLRGPPPTDNSTLPGDTTSSALDYSGPRLYVKPTSKSNRHIITNAIAHCILAGVVNKDQKEKVLQEVAKSDAKHFLILFRDHGLQFRALYSFSPDTEEIFKLYGVGPKHISPNMICGLYKYNSGGKQFAKIPSKTMSVSVDGVTIENRFWQSKKSITKKH